MKKKKAILTIGVPCSGKTTWATEFVTNNPTWINICRDDIRENILYVKKQIYPFTWKEWDWKYEDEVTEEQHSQIVFGLKSPLIEGIIISDTNLNLFFRNRLIKKLVEFGFEVEYKFFHVSWEEAIKRDTERFNGVGYSVLEKHFNKYYHEFTPQYKPNLSKPKAIIVDLDGTLALRVTNRSWFDWLRVGEDVVSEPVKLIVKNFKQVEDYKIIIVSGRDEICRKITFDWLIQNLGFEPDLLLMREKGSFVDDSIIKEEFFWKYIDKEYNVQLVLDDRPKVSRMYRKLGLTVLQAGDPYLEF